MPFILALIFVGTIICLVYANWRLWRDQIRVWRIPESEIKRLAEELLRNLGRDQARQTVRRRGLEAWCRQDLVEHGKWERVARLFDSERSGKPQ